MVIEIVCFPITGSLLWSPNSVAPAAVGQSSDFGLQIGAKMGLRQQSPAAAGTSLLDSWFADVKLNFSVLTRRRRSNSKLCETAGGHRVTHLYASCSFLSFFSRRSLLLLLLLLPAATLPPRPDGGLVLPPSPNLALGPALLLDLDH